MEEGAEAKQTANVMSLSKSMWDRGGAEGWRWPCGNDDDDVDGDDSDDDDDNDEDDNGPCQFSKRTKSAASIRAKRAAAGAAHHMCNSQA